MALREAWLDYGYGPSQQELMYACKCSTTTVINAFRQLQKRGYITKRKFGYRETKPTNLDLTLSCTEPEPWAELDEPKKFWERKPE